MRAGPRKGEAGPSIRSGGSAISAHTTLFVVVAFAAGGCELFPFSNPESSGGDEPSHGGYYSHAEVLRYPPATLPWTLNPNDIDTHRNIWFMDPASVTQEHAVNMEGRRTFQVTEPLGVQVVALEDLIVVIFRPESGLPKLAWAGRDTPWTATDFPGAAGGDLDAISGPDGRSVHALSRDRAGNMSYVVWRPDAPGPDGAVAGGSFETETTALGGATGDGDWGCPDLSLALSDEGHVDIAFLNGSLWHGRRDAETGEWTRDVIWDFSRDCCPDEQGRRPPPTHSFGCRNVIGHDESGYPAVLTLGRPLLSRGSPDMAYQRNFPWGFKMGANGVWQQDGPFVHRQRSRHHDPVPAEMTWTGRFDMLRHPAGFLIAGVAYTDDSYWLQPFSPRRAFGNEAAEAGSQPWKAGCNDYCEWRGYGVGHPREVVRIQRDACGAILSWIPPTVKELDPRGLPRFYYMQSYRAGDGGRHCRTAGFAPIVSRPEDHLEENVIREVVYTHGEAPFHAALCLVDDGRMVVCGGSYGAQVRDLRSFHGPGSADWLTPLPVDDVIEIVAHEPADGAVVQPGRPTISVTLSDWRGEKTEPGLAAALFDTFIGIAWPVERTWDPETKTITLTPTEELRPGHGYRVELGGVEDTRGRDAPVLHRGKARYFDFVVDGSPFSRADPRSAEGFAWECFERAADGICHFGEVDPDSEGEGFSVGRNGMLLGYPWPTDAAALTGPGGAAVESKTVVDALHGTITLSWEAPLEPETTYEVTLPVLYDSNGLPLLEADRTVRFTTLAPIE